MTNEYINLEKKVDEFDAFISENLDISNPLGLYSTNYNAPENIAVEEFRKALTVLLSKLSSPKNSEEAFVRRRALVQMQFMWVLMDIALKLNNPDNVKVFCDDPELKFKCICLSLKQGGMLSKSIDFDTITWIRVIDAPRLRKHIENGLFKGILNPGPGSIYYGLQKCELGPQLILDFCIYDMNAKITELLYKGDNPIKFTSERKYNFSVINKAVKINENAEKYWFMHILDTREEMLFRIRCINAFSENLRVLYATECMMFCCEDYDESILTEINYDALKLRGISELMRAYKAMYDLSQDKAFFMFRGRTEESNRYMNSFVSLYREIKDTLITDKGILDFQKSLLTFASKQEYGDYYFGIAKSLMSLNEDSQKEIIKEFEGSSSTSFSQLEQKIARIIESENLGEGEKESLEEYTARMSFNVNDYMTVHKKLEDSYKEKLGRYSGFFSDGFRRLIEETLSDPDQTLEIAYENNL